MVTDQSGLCGNCFLVYSGRLFGPHTLFLYNMIWLACCHLWSITDGVCISVLSNFSILVLRESRQVDYDNGQPGNVQCLFLILYMVLDLLHSCSVHKSMCWFQTVDFHPCQKKMSNLAITICCVEKQQQQQQQKLDSKKWTIYQPGNPFYYETGTIPAISFNLILNQVALSGSGAVGRWWVEIGELVPSRHILYEGDHGEIRSYYIDIRILYTKMAWIL